MQLRQISHCANKKRRRRGGDSRRHRAPEDNLPQASASVKPAVLSPSPEEIRQLAGLLNSGKAVTILGGAGCAGAHAEVNNSALSFVELEMKAAGILEEGTELVNPDFVALAQSASVFGVRVEDPADLKEAVTAAFQHSGPALVDAVVNRTGLAQAEARKPRAPRVLIVDEVAGVDKERRCNAAQEVIEGRWNEEFPLAFPDRFRHTDQHECQ
jgi:thiamine pyrophosphate-dependent acetolactate synthase large subunit-like protein